MGGSNEACRGGGRTEQSILCQRSPPCKNSPSSDKKKVHKMCARYCEIPDVKFRQGLGFGPIINEKIGNISHPGHVKIFRSHRKFAKFSITP